MTVLEILTASYVDYAVDVSFSKSEDIHSHLLNQPKKNVSIDSIDAHMFKVYLLPQLGDHKLEHIATSIATINAPNSGVTTPGIPWASFL